MKKILSSGLVAVLLAGCSTVSSNTRSFDSSYKPKELDFPDAVAYKTLWNYKFPDSKDADSILLALYNASVGKVKIVLDRPQDNHLSCSINFNTESLDNAIDFNFLVKLDSNHDYKITMNELMRTYIGVCTESIPISSLR